MAGSAWGAIPVLPWLVYLWHSPPQLTASAPSFPRTMAILGFLRMAFEVSLSQTADFNVGGHFQEYLTYPVLFGVSTNGVSVARTFLHVIGMIAFVVAVAATFERLRSSAAGRRFSDTALCLFIAVLTGIFVSVAEVPNSPHHHLMVFPIEYLWIPAAVIAYLPRPRIWLTAVWLGSAVCTFAFLQFIHQHCGAPEGEYGIAYRCQEHGRAGVLAGRPAEIQPLIRPGQEDLIARMLARGEALPGSCRLVEGRIDHTFASGSYACAEGTIGLRLVHPSSAPATAPLTKKFAVVVEGTPPPGLVDAITEHVRRDEAGFEWLLEARDAAGLRPYDDYLPVLTSRQILVRMVGGAMILLLLSSAL